MNAVYLGIDGYAECGDVSWITCRPTNPCNIDPCSFICNFINYLPSGPMWDEAKEHGRRNTQLICSGGTMAQLCPPDTFCSTIVDHARYVAQRTLFVLQGPLMGMVAESSPYTAFLSLDDWVKRSGWFDCFNSSCRDPSLGALTPVERLCLRRMCHDTSEGKQMAGDPWAMGPVYSPPEFDPALVRAVKRGIIIAMDRINMEAIRTIDSINFAIQELGAEISVKKVEDYATATTACHFVPECDCPGTNESANQMMGDQGCVLRFPKIELQICSASTLIKTPSAPDCYRPNYSPAFGSNGNECSGTMECGMVKAYWENNDCGLQGILPPKIWPGVLAAECIVRAYLPSNVNWTLTRCC